MTPAWLVTGASHTEDVRNVLPARSPDMSVTRTPGAVSVPASRREPSARNVFREPGTTILSEAASSVGVTSRARWEVSVTNRLDCVAVLKGLKANTVISAELASTTFQTAGPATVIQPALRPPHASKFITRAIHVVSLYHCIIVSLCRDGVCQCDSSGSCPCKRTAVGKKCASCQRGYFGLSQVNTEGCTKCFCFGRSGDCRQAPHSWTQVRGKYSL